MLLMVLLYISLFTVYSVILIDFFVVAKVEFLESSFNLRLEPTKHTNLSCI